MARAVDAIEASGSADNPRAVAGAMWARKSPGQKRAIIASEEGTAMAAKRKKKKHPKKKKPHHPKRAKKRAKKKKHAKHGKRCVHCGHTAPHGRAGCLHHSGMNFCKCTSRH
jgi:hypothetical protein